MGEKAQAFQNKLTGSSASRTARLARTPSEFAEQTLQSSIAAGLLNDEQTVAAFVDVDGVRATIEQLKEAFPAHFQHTFAAKANTMSAALKLVASCGIGCEVASRGELEQALRSGFEPSQLVYDEPTKTPAMLRRLLDHGISLNLDNFQEFERVRDLIGDSKPDCRIGFRINPQIGSGTITAMSTAKRSSKFGVPLEDEGVRRRLFGCYRDNQWMNSLHTHIGSQGCELELMAEGIARVFELAEGINDLIGRHQIRVIDIGGGLPVNFESDEVRPRFSDYAEVLRERVPGLFSGKYIVKTEFGRSIFAKNGFVAARVEYTKLSGGKHIALTHAGVQVATRTVFMPDHWAIRVAVHDENGARREGDEVLQDVGGPCCFAGDLVAVDRMLPLIQPGDHIVLHDTGAYYFSNPFYYNSLPAVAVYGVEEKKNQQPAFDTWRQQQSLDDLLEMLG